MNETAPEPDVIIGVDTHKLTHAAVAINALGVRLGAITIPASTRGYGVLQTWARSLGPVFGPGLWARSLGPVFGPGARLRP